MGNVIISPHAHVGADVELPDHAEIRGMGLVLSAGDVLVMGPSRRDGKTYCTAHRDKQLPVRVNRGCYSGDLEGFIQLARGYAKNHPDQLAQALEYAEQIRAHFGIE